VRLVNPSVSPVFFLFLFSLFSSFPQLEQHPQILQVLRSAGRLLHRDQIVQAGEPRRRLPDGPLHPVDPHLVESDAGDEEVNVRL